MKKNGRVIITEKSLKAFSKENGLDSVIALGISGKDGQVLSYDVDSSQAFQYIEMLDDLKRAIVESVNKKMGL